MSCYDTHISFWASVHGIKRSAFTNTYITRLDLLDSINFIRTRCVHTVCWYNTLGWSWLTCSAPVGGMTNTNCAVIHCRSFPYNETEMTTSIWSVGHWAAMRTVVSGRPGWPERSFNWHSLHGCVFDGWIICINTEYNHACLSVGGNIWDPWGIYLGLCPNVSLSRSLAFKPWA